MRERVVDLHWGEEVVLLGRFGSLSHLPPAMRDSDGAAAMMRRAMADVGNARRVRSYFSAHFAAPAMARCTDAELAGMVEAALRSNRMQAAVLKRNWPHLASKPVRAQVRQAPLPTQAAAAGSRSAAIPLAPAAPAPSGPRAPAPVSDRPAGPVGSWPMEDRLIEVIKLAAERVPGDLKQALLGLLTPESIALMAGLLALAAAAHLTPFGWAADAFLLGLAFAAGGMAAIHAAGNLFDCFVTINGAKTDEDLEKAADHLAAAVVDIGIIGLIAILRRFSRGSEGNPGNLKPTGKPTRRTVEAKAASRPRARSGREAKAAESTPKPPTQPPSSSADAAPGTPAQNKAAGKKRTRLTAAQKKKYARPSGFRKGVREKVWNDAKSPEGKVIDPLTGEEIKAGQAWDMGHRPGMEFRKHQSDAANRGITRKQFLDEYNDPAHYRPETPSSNRSHKGEDMTDDFLGV